MGRIDAPRPRAEAPAPVRAPSFSLRRVRTVRGGAPVLNGVTADLPAGRVCAVVGPSGSGKTSLLRLLNRLDEVGSGSIRVDGVAIHDIPVRELRRRVGFVFQRPAIFAGTVEANLRLALEIAGEAGDDDDERVLEALRDAELPEDFLPREARALSGGEQQRVTLARALVLRPQALLLDEPTSALDPEIADRIVGTIGDMSARRGITIVLSTHRLEEARRVADVVVLLRAGEVAAIGSPDQVLRRRPEVEP
jgi:putative ABC transport system ATP-binding protein